MRNLNVLVLALCAAPLLGGCYARARGSAYVYTPAPRAYVATQPAYVAPPAYQAPPPQQQVVYDDVVYVAPPPAIETSPYVVVYNGQQHYYYGGRWYRRGGNGWVVYNSEPGWAYSERTRRGWTVTTTAPPAYGPSYGAPPPVYTPPPTYAPPARPAYVPPATQAPPAYGGGATVTVGGSVAPPAVRATTSAPPAH